MTRSLSLSVFSMDRELCPVFLFGKSEMRKATRALSFFEKETDWMCGKVFSCPSLFKRKGRETCSKKVNLNWNFVSLCSPFLSLSFSIHPKESLMTRTHVSSLSCSIKCTDSECREGKEAREFPFSCIWNSGIVTELPSCWTACCLRFTNGSRFTNHSCSRKHRMRSVCDRFLPLIMPLSLFLHGLPAERLLCLPG